MNLDLASNASDDDGDAIDKKFKKKTANLSPAVVTPFNNNDSTPLRIP